MHVPRENSKGSFFRPAILVLTTLVAAAMLAAVGFGIGWFLSGRQLANAGGGDGPPPVTTVPEHEATLPTSDVTGEDLPGLPRYPDSVRVDYQRKVVERKFVLTRVTYKAAAKTNEVKDFYRGVFQSGDWTVADLDFSGGTWSFMVVDDRRQAYLEIAPQGESLVEVDIRLSEPHADQESQEEDTDSPKRGGASSQEPRKPKPSAPSGEQETPSPSAPATPAPSYNSPAPSYSAPAPSYPAPGGGLEDDYEEDYDDYGEDDYDD